MKIIRMTETVGPRVLALGTFDGMLRLDGKPGYKGVFTNEKAKTVDFELSVL